MVTGVQTCALPIFLAFSNTFFTQLSGTAFWHIAPISCAIGYLMLYTLQERGLFSSFGILRSSLALIVLIISFLGLKYFSLPLQIALDTPLFPPLFHGLSKANDFTLIMTMIALMVIFLISLLFDAYHQKAPFWMLASLMCSFLFLQDAHSFILFSLVAALVAISALISDAYKMAYIDTLTKIPGR